MLRSEVGAGREVASSWLHRTVEVAAFRAAGVGIAAAGGARFPLLALAVSYR